VAIAENHVDVEGGDGIHSIAFDLAVVATGSRYVDPLIKAEVPTVVERSAQIAAANRQLANARSVVVAGGGPVGVETAAELSVTSNASRRL
jgi:pyruvate/2-oxoglutarate dehydrogenase complex dihydrolipoamide dehydrogenase (E3) component